MLCSESMSAARMSLYSIVGPNGVQYSIVSPDGVQYSGLQEMQRHSNHLTRICYFIYCLVTKAFHWLGLNL